jgi:hypothetical protein
VYPNLPTDSKMKKKFINVVPVSKIAKNRFDNYMKNYHSCLILNEDENLYHLMSINGMYEFHLQKSGNEHWQIVK